MDITTLAGSVAEIVTSADPEWATTPGNLLPGTLDAGEETVSAAQALYALAMLVGSTHAGLPAESVVVPETTGVPPTYTVLKEMGCVMCIDTAWSLKPARIQELAR
jgi:hypothetical protein